MNKWFKLTLILLLISGIGYSQAVSAWKGWIAGQSDADVTETEAEALAVLADAIDGGDTVAGTALKFNGAFTNAVIDFSDVGLDYGGSSGPVFLRAGTYGSPVSSADAGQSGMIRLYGLSTATTDNEATGYYDRSIFAYLRTDGSKGIFPIAGLAEVRTVSGDGPLSVQGGQFIAGLHTSGAKLAATAGTTDGMFGLWSKVYSAPGAVAAATSRVASIWLDSQLHGTTSGENYAAFITNGGLKEDAVFAFETGNDAGWTNLLYFDETAYDQDPISDLGAKNEVNSDKSIKIDLNGTTYYIPIFLLTNME